MRKIREALRLHYDAGLGVRAISRSLKASPSTVRGKRPGNGVIDRRGGRLLGGSSDQVGGGESGRQQRFDVAERLGPGQLDEHPAQVRVGFEAVRLRALNELMESSPLARLC